MHFFFMFPKWEHLELFFGIEILYVPFTSRDCTAGHFRETEDIDAALLSPPTHFQLF